MRSNKTPKTVRLTLRNDHHRTETALAAKVLADGSMVLSAVQVKRAKAALCVAGCVCSGATGTRNGGAPDITTSAGAPVEIVGARYVQADGSPGLLLVVHDTDREARARDAARMGA